MYEAVTVTDPMSNPRIVWCVVELSVAPPTWARAEPASRVPASNSIAILRATTRAPVLFIQFIASSFFGAGSARR